MERLSSILRAILPRAPKPRPAEPEARFDELAPQAPTRAECSGYPREGCVTGYCMTPPPHHDSCRFVCKHDGKAVRAPANRVFSPSSVPRYSPGPDGVAEAIDDAVLRRHRHDSDADRHQRDVVNHAPFAYVDMGSASCSDSGGSSGSCGGCGGGD